VHPIERLRMVARATGEGPELLAREAAGAMAAFCDDPAGLVTACRRLVDRQPTSGPMWWLAARVLAASDPAAEAWQAADELDADDTPAIVAAAVPDDATVVVVGWPEQAGRALRRRGDLDVLVVNAGGEGDRFARRLARLDVSADCVPDVAAGAAVAASDLVLLEASALGPTGFVGRAGSRAAAAVAKTAGIPVWVVAGAGRVLPGRLWDALLARLDTLADAPWLADEEVVPLALADQVVGPAGAQDAARAPRRADCPIAPELLRGVD
jgi:hypothetical protein